MKYLWTIIFFSFLSLILLLEGLGIGQGREVSYFFILAFSFFLFFADFLGGEKEYYYPKNISVFFLLFLLFSLISIVTSLDMRSSFQQALLYASLFLIFVSVFNHQEEVKKIFPGFFLSVSVFFSLYSFFLGKLQNSLPFLVPTSGYQVVFSRFGSHNHLGDLFAVSLILSLYLFTKTNKWMYALLSAFFVPFFLLSYSRSAYLAFMVGLVALGVLVLRKNKLFFGVLLFLSALFFVTSVKEASFVPLLKPVHDFLVQSTGLLNKYAVAKRTEFAQEAFSAFFARPFFGSGPATFGYASLAYSKIPNFLTCSSHNLFLDVLTETGIFGFIPFILFVLALFTNAMKKMNIYFFLFLTLFINFQTDYTHTIYLFLTLFFIFCALMLPMAKTKISSRIPFGIATFLFALALFLLVNTALSQTYESVCHTIS